MDGDFSVWLAEHPAFAESSPGALSRLTHGATAAELNAGVCFLVEGEPSDTVCVVLEGMVRTYHVHPDSRQRTTAYRRAPAIIGVEEVLAEKPVSQNCETLTQALVIRLNAEQFLSYLDGHPAAARSLLADLSSRWCAGIEDDRFRFCDVAGRMAHLLVGQAELFGREVDDGIAIRRLITQQDLANDLGVTARSVRRVLGHWRDLGWVSRRKGWLVVHRLEHLEILCRDCHSTYSPPDLAKSA